MTTFTEEEVTRRLTAILAEILVMSPEEIHPGSLLVDELDADSIAFLELNYRLKSDFGIATPNPKVDESTLSMPAPEALRKIEVQLGGTTLFEFMKDEAVRSAAVDPTTRRAMGEALMGGMEDGGGLSLLKAGLATAVRDPAARTLVSAVLDDVGADPDASDRLRRATDADPELRERLAAFREPGPEGAAAEDAEAQRKAFHDLILRDMDLERLARFMGGEVPSGLDPGSPVSSIRLRDLFRFITVQSYVRYVLFLSAGSGGPGSRAEDGPAAEEGV